jgi:sortase A
VTARRITGVVGELFITAGVLVLLFVGYQLGWTNYQADRAAAANTDQLENAWERPGVSMGPEYDLPIQNGDPFAELYIPRLGKDYKVPIVQGVALDDLAQGVGHYPETAMPGDIGNFSVAGHRATNGEPFAYLDQVQTGDQVVVETATTWYTYEVYKKYIVQPTAVDVVLPVPNKPGAEPKRALMTMTTCNPRWASYERLIFHAKLTQALPKQVGTPSALQGIVH